MAALKYLKYLAPRGYEAPTLSETRGHPRDVRLFNKEICTTFEHTDHRAFLRGRLSLDSNLQGTPESEKQQLEARIAELESIKARLALELEAAQSSAASEREQCSKLDIAVAHLQSQLQHAQLSLAAERNRCSDLTASVSALEAERQDLLELQAAHIVEMQVAQGELADALADVAELLKEKDALSTALQQSQLRADELGAELKYKNDGLAQLYQHIVKHTAMIAELSKTGDLDGSKFRAAQQELLAERNKLDDALSALQQLESECDAFDARLRDAEQELFETREALFEAEANVAEERAAKEEAIRELEEFMAHTEQLELDAQERERQLREEFEEERRQRFDMKKAFEELKAQFEMVQKENSELREENYRCHQQMALEKDEQRSLRDELARVQTTTSARIMELVDENKLRADENRILQEKSFVLEESSDAQSHQATEADEHGVQVLERVKEQLVSVQGTCAALTAQLEAMDNENADLHASLASMNATSTALQEARRVNTKLKEEIARCKCRKVLADVSNVTKEIENCPEGENASREKGKAVPVKRWDSLFWKKQEKPAEVVS